ncbi:hypothetical protein LOZ66_001894 [Ophidiomyces ophidiicola]|nr:hypothetical protein LOZ66_001894 [Ophidiomyces ophidiicola]
MSKDAWKPAWEEEQRVPSFITPSMNLHVTKYGGSKYMWGNMPALDLISLQSNEGKETSQGLQLLLAGTSGDPRNLIKTVAALPDGYSGKVDATLNDADFSIVARNVILLLTALHLPPETATPIILHTWYSAQLPASMLGVLHTEILPLVEAVAKKVKNKAAKTLLAKTWTYGQSSLRLDLVREQWLQLPAFFKVPAKLSVEEASRLRSQITMAPSREDYAHRALCMQPPSWRLSKVIFRTDGILLPFGSPREEFDTPNPTFFQSGGWPMSDSSDPLGGWDLKTVMQNALPAKHDLYGALFFHLRDIILKFCLHLTTLNVHIKLLHVHAAQLPSFLKGEHFDRIEISNICDRGYLGVETCLSIFSPLLKPKEDNPHATLLALFMNAVEEEDNAADYLTGRGESITRATSYIPGFSQAVGSRNQYSPASLKIMQTVAAFRNFDAMFKRFMLNTRFAELTRAYRLQTRENHTIVSPWPARLKDTPTQSEFELFHGGEQSGTERYVEWVRAD